MTPLFAAYCLYAGAAPVGTLAALAAGIYWPGVFQVTVFGNVPMNKQLPSMPPDHAETRDCWKAYVGRWSRLNHLRTAGCIASSIAYAFAA